MRYALERYDNVFGTSEVSMICNDAYFNRSETTYYGSGFTSVEDALNAINGFLGTNDVGNINNIHYIPVPDSPCPNIIDSIAQALHLIPFTNLTYDNNFHQITGIIKINNKTTIFSDYGYGESANIPDDQRSNYRGGYNQFNSYTLGPWFYEITCGSWKYNTLRGHAGVGLYFSALPENVISDGVIDIPSDSKIALIHIVIESNDVDLLSLIPESYVTSVRIDTYDISTSVLNLLNEDEVNPQDDPNNDPYAGNTETGGSSGTGGGHYGPGTGTYSPESDPNPIPSLPGISASDTGFITLFNPTSAQLKNLADYMWGSLFDISTWKKIFADPMDCILGLSIVPVNIPYSSTETVKVGNISTGVTMNKANTQFVEVDCGSISITEKWKAYLDYSPYTKLNIYLPYIGAHDLNIDDIQVNTIGVKYHIDILSGACVAYVTAGGNVIAQYSGQCSISIPVTSKDFTQTIIALGTLVAGGVTAVASGGLSAPVSAAAIGGQATAMANTAANVITSKPSIQKSGNMSGSNGLMGIQKPYLFITRPKQCAPKNQNRYSGYPAYITEKLGDLSGFTQIQDIRLEGITGTQAELDEILNCLHEGVIL